MQTGGYIVVMDAFLAFLEHVHSSLTTTYHNTPIMLMASPQWTRPDCETLARYIFEKTKTPALCLINSAIATQYGLKWPNMTVVDIGFEKVDVTCIYDSRIVAHRDVGAGWPSGNSNNTDEEKEISGGEVFTRKLQKLLKDKIKGFNRDMAEQLKKSNICEVLPYAPDKPKLMDLPTEDVPAAAGAGASTTGSAAAQAASATTTEGPKIVEPVADEPTYDADGNLVDDEGVLDVANIVATGQTREFLAKKEKEKQEKAKKKGKDKEAEANRIMRLPNSKKVKNVFHFEEYITEEVPIVQPAAPAPAPAPAAAPAAPATTEGAKDVEMADAPAPPAEGAEKKDEEKKEDGEKKDEAKTEEQKPDVPASDDKKPEEKPSEPAPAPAAEAPKPTEAPKPAEPTAAPSAPEGPVPTERQTKRIRRDIEVGLERFEFADRAEIDRIVTAIYNAVQSIDDMYMRPPCWESLVFVGNGARIRGLKENILQTLQARHLISPSSATMFTSELPSNIGTPTAGTPGPGGASTPIPSGLGAQSGSLLQAATTAAANANLNVPGAQGVAGGESQHGQHHFHSQTPTNIKLAQLPTYLSEWTKNGFEEAMFLGAQVAARLAFCIHNFDAQGLEMQRYMSLSRVDYK